jgi:hypothetical protein
MKIALFILFLIALVAFGFVNQRLMTKSGEAAGSWFSAAYVFKYATFPEFYVLLLLGAAAFGLVHLLGVGLPGVSR